MINLTQDGHRFDIAEIAQQIIRLKDSIILNDGTRQGGHYVWPREITRDGIKYSETQSDLEPTGYASFRNLANGLWYAPMIPPNRTPIRIDSDFVDQFNDYHGRLVIVRYQNNGIYDVPMIPIQPFGKDLYLGLGFSPCFKRAYANQIRNEDWTGINIVLCNAQEDLFPDMMVSSKVPLATRRQYEQAKDSKYQSTFINKFKRALSQPDD